MAKNDSIRLKERIYSISKKIVKQKFPEELEFFDIVWKVMQDLPSKWKDKVPEEWPIETYQQELKKEIGFLDETEVLDINTPKVIALIALSLLRLIGTGSQIKEETIEETISKYGKDLPDQLKLRTIDYIVPLVKEDLRKIRKIRFTEVEKEKGKYIMYYHDFKKGKPITESEYVALIEIDKADYSIWMDEINHEFYIYGDECEETDPIQKKFLKILIKRAGRTVSYQKLFEDISSIAQDSEYSGWHKSYKKDVYGWFSELHKNTNHKLLDIVINVRKEGYKLKIRMNKEEIKFCLIEYKRAR